MIDLQLIPSIRKYFSCLTLLLAVGFLFLSRSSQYKATVIKRYVGDVCSWLSILIHSSYEFSSI